MKKNATKAARARRPQPPVSPSYPFTPTERAGLKTLIEEVLNEAKQAFAAFGALGPVSGMAQGMAAIPTLPSSPPIPIPNTVQQHERVSKARERIAKAHKWWNDSAAKLSNTDPMDPGYYPAVINAEDAAHNFIEEAAFYRDTISGMTRG